MKDQNQRLARSWLVVMTAGAFFFYSFIQMTLFSTEAMKAYFMATLSLNDPAAFGRFEEPLSPQHPELFARLHAKLDVALATGECEQTRYGFQRLLSSGGVQIAQPDLAYCGGPSEALKIRAVASSLGVNVIPHAWGTMLNLAAALHFLACTYMEPGRAEAAEPVLEYDRSPNRLREELFETPLRIEGAVAHVPAAPGLGVAVDRAAVQAFLVRETRTE